MPFPKAPATDRQAAARALHKELLEWAQLETRSIEAALSVGVLKQFKNQHTKLRREERPTTGGRGGLDAITHFVVATGGVMPAANGFTLSSGMMVEPIADGHVRPLRQGEALKRLVALFVLAGQVTPADLEPLVIAAEVAEQRKDARYRARWGQYRATVGAAVEHFRKKFRAAAMRVTRIRPGEAGDRV